MKEKEIEKHSCETCLHYSPHYIKQKTRFVKIFCGDCLFKNVKKRNAFDFCENYAVTPDKTEERDKSVKDFIKFIAKRLDEIALVLDSGE